MNNDNSLYIVYSTDNNYAQYAGVSIISLFENNKHFDKIFVYIIDNEIKIDNKEKLLSISHNYNRTIQFINFTKFKEKLTLNMGWKISISAYARLFLASMIPVKIEKVLYFDCDSIINNCLDELWSTDISGYSVAGVEDTVSNKLKEKTGMSINSKYINSGMLLINLKNWRETNIEEKFIKFIDNHDGNVIHHDQGIINGVLSSWCKILPPKFNAMTVFFTMKRKNFMKYYNIEGDYYLQSEINEAVNNPVFIHFTPSFVKRPWIKGCKHPKKHLYFYYLKKSPWKDLKVKNDNEKIKIRMVSWCYNNLPFNLVDCLIKAFSK